MKLFRLVIAPALLSAAAACGSVAESGDDGGAATCEPHETRCSGACVDLETSQDHCGACGSACDANQGCIDSSCTALDPLIDPAFDSRWPDPTGWIDQDGNPIEATLSGDGDVPGAVYECRTGPRDSIGDASFAPCDGDDGTEPVHAPPAPDGKDQGFFVTQMRIRVGSYVSETVEFDYYVHRSLDAAETCDSPLTDADVFAVADSALNNPTETFPADTVTRNPFLDITFQSIQVSHDMIMGDHVGKWDGMNGSDYQLEGHSLRRRFALSDDNRLLLLTRQYVSRRALAFGENQAKCRNGFIFGSRRMANRELLDCTFLVLDATGRGACITNDGGSPAAGPVSSHAYAKLSGKRAFSAKGPDAMCPASEFQPSACNWYLQLPE